MEDQDAKAVGAKDVFVELFRTHDELEAIEIQDVLTQEGIEAAKLGPVHPASHMEVGQLAHWTIEVPAKKADAAANIVRAFTAEVEDEGPGDEDGLPWELREGEDEDGA